MLSFVSQASEKKVDRHVSQANIGSFSTINFPAKGLSLLCRTTTDVITSDYDKDGRLFISATLNNNKQIDDVVFEIKKTSNFSNAYKSKISSLTIKEIQIEGQTLKIIDSFRDSQFSFLITQFPMDFDSLVNRIDTFSANVGLTENPGSSNFAQNYELRCTVRKK